MRETKFWTWHMIAGVVILVLLGIHMIYTHVGELTGFLVFTSHPDPIGIENSQARDRMPIFPVIFILLLGIALYHGLYGLRTILFEACSNRSLQKALSVILLLVGIGLFGLGSWAAVKAHSNAKAASPPEISALVEERR